MDVVMVDKVVEEDNKVVEEVKKKLVKEYNDFCWNFPKVEGPKNKLEVIMDVVVVDKVVEEVNKKFVREYNNLF